MDQPSPQPFSPEDLEAAQATEQQGLNDAQMDYLQRRTVFLSAACRRLERDLVEAQQRIADLEAVDGDGAEPDTDTPQDPSEGPWGGPDATVDPMSTNEPPGPETPS